jgi:fructose-specific phosphotransferase system IIC component
MHAQDGWVVQRVQWMQKTLFHIGQADFPVHQLLQHAGSMLGSVALIATYVCWLRRQPRRALEQDAATSERTRFLIIVVGIVTAVAIALPLGWQATTAFTGYTRLRAASFQAAIYAAQVFVPLFVATAVILYRWQRRPR